MTTSEFCVHRVIATTVTIDCDQAFRLIAHGGRCLDRDSMAQDPRPC